jgi:magnesium-transporting ATPase (P-type)
LYDLCLVILLHANPVHRIDIDRSASFSADRLQAKYERLALFELDRNRKSMSVLCSPSEDDSGSNNSGQSKKNVLLAKGAAEVLLDRCNRVKLEDGTIVPISPTMRAQIADKIGPLFWILKAVFQLYCQCIIMGLTFLQES